MSPIIAVSPGAGRQPRTATLSPVVIEQMLKALPVQTSECVMDVFGISLNTWTKLKKGQPVRASVVERLMQRGAVERLAITHDSEQKA